MWFLIGNLSFLFWVFTVINCASLNNTEDYPNSLWIVTISPHQLCIQSEIMKQQPPSESSDEDEVEEDQVIKFSLYQNDDLLEILQQKAVFDSNFQMTLTSLTDKELVLVIIQPLTRWFGYYVHLFDELSAPLKYRKRSVDVQIKRSKVLEFAAKYASPSPFSQPLLQDILNLNQCVTDQLQRFNILYRSESIKQLQVSVLKEYLKKNQEFLLQKLNENCQSKLDIALIQILENFDAQVFIQN